MPVVQYLLEQGAICEEGEFLSERCFYGALNDGIRDVLKKHKYTASMRSPYREFWRKVWVGWKRNNSDFGFICHRSDDLVDCHKIVLYVRCPRFREMLSPDKNGPWIDRNTKVTQVPRTALVHVLCWLYTGKVELPVASVAVTANAFAAVGLHREAELVLQACDRRTVAGSKGMITVEDSDLQGLAGAWQEFVAGHVLRGNETKCERSSFHYFSDVCIDINQDQGQEQVQPCCFYLHRFILEHRSEYFRTLFASPLTGGQSTNSSGMTTISLRETDAASFATVVSYMYGNTTPDLLGDDIRGSGSSGTSNSGSGSSSGSCSGTGDDSGVSGVSGVCGVSGVSGVSDDIRMERAVSRALSVLDCAERLMLPGLKTLVGAALKKILHCRSGEEPYPASTVGGAAFVFEALRASRTFALPPLENACYEVIAAHLMDIADDAESVE